jgi:hypothetical protein
MKRILCMAVIICAASSLPAQTPKTETIKLLDPTERKNWEVKTGDWKFEGSKVIGTGDSKIIFNRAFKTPYRITFGFEMLEGTRPAIGGFGRYTLMTEGTGTSLFLSPVAPNRGSFPYELKRKYRIRIDVTPKKLELRINNRLVETREPGMELVPPIHFNAGDGYSQGRAEFSDIEVTAVPEK